MPIKGRISLGEFIRDVKKELVEAVKNRGDEPFFALTDVELEASFSLEAEGEVGMKFIVEAKGATTASQVHKVTLKFKTLAQGDEEVLADEASEIVKSIKRLSAEEIGQTILPGPKIEPPLRIGPIPLQSIDPTGLPSKLPGPNIGFKDFKDK
ncbi:trypco2 family protein [Polaromonas sp.]|uniref:trypco2 family protein n=1 Tax=Polaromonas sp. TaxID=1869339 RepID=UPI002FC95761